VTPAVGTLMADDDDELVLFAKRHWLFNTIKKGHKRRQSQNSLFSLAFF
jgi:hypothetical protein